MAKKRSRWVGAVVVAAALAGGAGWWAGLQVASPTVEAEVPRAAAFVLADVTEASVGRSLPLSVTVSQPVKAVARNVLTGVVVGDVPFLRVLGVGARGGDVTQLEDALVTMGLLARADGYYGTGTVAAVKAWQKSLGIEATGAVPLGQVVAVPALPGQVSLGESIVVGGVLAGGEESVLASTGERVFELEVSEQQSKLIPEGSTVNVTFGKKVWPAVMSGSRFDEARGNVVYSLTAPDGGLVCAGDCAGLPAQPKVQLRSEVLIVPKVTGPAVPAAAVRTRADGTSFVVAESGAEVPVTVSASSSGVVVVDGVAVGTRVQVPADPAGNG